MKLKKDYLYTTDYVRSPGNDLLRMTYSKGRFSGPQFYIYKGDIRVLEDLVSHRVSNIYSRHMRLFLSSFQMTSVYMINSQFR